MPLMTSILRALGNERAVANATAAVDARRREDWLVTGLARRLDQTEGGPQHAVGDDSGVDTHVAV